MPAESLPLASQIATAGIPSPTRNLEQPATASKPPGQMFDKPNSSF